MGSIIKRPINITIAWWVFWGFVSMFSLTGLYVPTQKTYLIWSLFVLSLFLGGKIARYVKIDIEQLNPERDRIVENILNLSYKILTSLFLIVLLFLIVRSTFLLMASEDPPSYKFNAFSTLDRVGILFNNRTAENLYFLISSPVLFFLALFGLVDFWRNGKFQKLGSAFVLNGMDAYIRLGRVNLYMMILLFSIVFIMTNNHLVTFIRSKKKQLLVVFLTFISILVIGAQRGYTPSQQLKLFVIDYHTVGFTLFDHELKDKSSPLNNNTTYGRLSIGGLETILTIMIRRFDKDYYSPALANSIRMADNSIIVGVEDPPTRIFKGVKVYNSFYTLLYTFYSDGGYLGIILGGIILGFLLEYFYRKFLIQGKVIDLFLLILVVSVVLLSIFMSQLEIMRTWIVLILLIFLDFYSRRKVSSGE